MSRSRAAGRRAGSALVLTAVAFGLSWAWEVVQCRPFFVHPVPCRGGLAMAKSALGDVAMTWLAYVVVAVVSRGWDWIAQPWGRRQWTSILVLASAMSIGVERFALATGRWFYTAANPLVPGAGVSAVAVLQLLVLFPLSFGAAAAVYRRWTLGMPMPLRRFLFGLADLVFLASVTATAAWAMNIGHQSGWGFAVGMAVGMALAMAVHFLALCVAPVLGSIEAMVPSMLTAMVGSMGVCALHLLGQEPTPAIALRVGGGFGAAAFIMLKGYGWTYKRSLRRRRSAC